MDYFPSMNGHKYETMRQLLFDAVSRGDVRGMLNDEVVPRAHIAVYLSLYSHAATGQEAGVIPPDLALNYDDLCAVFFRPVVDGRKRGRPVKEHNGWPEDRKLAFEMHKMLAGNSTVPRAKSASEAARILVDQGRVSGAGTPESRAKRLERAFRKYYSS